VANAKRMAKVVACMHIAKDKVVIIVSMAIVKRTIAAAVSMASAKPARLKVANKSAIN